MPNIEQIEPWLRNAQSQRQTELGVSDVDPQLGQNNRRLINDIFPSIEVDKLSGLVDPLWDCYQAAATPQTNESATPSDQITALKDRLGFALKAERLADNFPNNASATDHHFVTVIKESVVHLIAQIYREIRQLQEQTLGSHQRLAELKREVLDQNTAEHQPYQQAA